ncbi:MAG: hypothetical protein JWN03_4980 [Nocardia sp.]|nr:hypothetical protein [Nocardia sp.]
MTGRAHPLTMGNAECEMPGDVVTEQHPQRRRNIEGEDCEPGSAHDRPPAITIWEDGEADGITVI